MRAPAARPARRGPPVLRRRSADSASPRRRMPRKVQRVGDRSVLATWQPTSSADPATRHPTCARGTSTRLTRCRTRAGSPTGFVTRPVTLGGAVTRPARGQRAGAGHVESVIRAKQAGFAPGFTMRDSQGAIVVRVVRRDGLPRSGHRRDPRRQQDLLDARVLAGGELPRHGPVRTRLVDRRHGDHHAASGMSAG